MDEHQPSTSHSDLERTTGPSDHEELSMSSSSDDEEPPAKRQPYVEEVRRRWNLMKVHRQLGTREQAIAFAEERGMLPRNKGKCERSKGTWFENVKIPIPQVFYLMYAFAERLNYNSTIKEDFSEGDHCLSRATVNDWFNYCREAVSSYQTNVQMISGKIGGPGKVVQIDESKFGKRKCNEGRQIEVKWIIRMIEEGKEDLRLEICPDIGRSAEILVPLIKKHVADGTTIHTDLWRAYDCLGDHGFVHKKVNSIVAEDGTHTQRIKAQWHVIKRFITKDNLHNSVNINSVIMEYLWRRDLERHRRDPFE